MADGVKPPSRDTQKPTEMKVGDTRQEFSDAMLIDKFTTPKLFKNVESTNAELNSKHLQNYTKTKQFTRYTKPNKADQLISQTGRSVISRFGKSSYAEAPPVKKGKATKHKP